VATYNRRRPFAAVSHLECVRAPGSLLDNISEQKPVDTAVHISCKYFWSVLKSSKVIIGIVLSIALKATTGSSSHVDNALPIGPENAREPDVVPSKD